MHAQNTTMQLFIDTLKHSTQSPSPISMVQIYMDLNVSLFRPQALSQRFLDAPVQHNCRDNRDDPQNGHRPPRDHLSFVVLSPLTVTIRHHIFGAVIPSNVVPIAAKLKGQQRTGQHDEQKTVRVRQMFNENNLQMSYHLRSTSTVHLVQRIAVRHRY